MNNEVEIEYLPTMGEAESMKTVKQGRRGTVNEYKKSGEVSELVTLSDNKTGTFHFKKRSIKGNSNSMTEVLAHRILKFEKASDKQKQVCKIFLETPYSSQCPRRLHKTKGLIQSINRTLFRLHKKYREI
jgi:hypothetical protein